MSESELAVVVAPQTFPTPILIERAGPSTRKKLFEFFTVPIRNANTRAAYYRAIQQFLAWCEQAENGAAFLHHRRLGRLLAQFKPQKSLTFAVGGFWERLPPAITPQKESKALT